MTRVAVLAAFMAPLLLGAALPDQFPTARFVDVPDHGVRRIAVDGAWVDVGATTCGAEPLGHPDCFGDADADSRYVVAVIRSHDGAPPLRITSGLGEGFRVAVGRLSPHDPHASLVILTDSGGSGGCISFQIAYAQPKGFAEARLNHGEQRGGDTSFCRTDPERIAFPIDRRGRGTADFVLADDAFDCAFGSCASTWAPPRVIAFDHGTSRDVSADPSLGPLFAADAARARAECERAGNTEPRSACVAYVADASRLGEGAKAMAVLRHRIGAAPDAECTSFTHGEAPRCLGEMHYATFADHARAFLDALGYPLLAVPQAGSTSQVGPTPQARSTS